MTDVTRVTRIRELNDRLRTAHQGGRVLVTAGIDALGPEAVAAILSAVAAFDDFSPDNDPYGEHDCAVQSVGDIRIIWKIDYYDTDLQFHSPDPADAAVTQRVMTVMLAEEY